MKQIEERPVGTIFGEEEVEAVRRILMSGDLLSRGDDVAAFEKEFATYCGAEHAVAVGSCGAALHMATKLLSLQRGDEVICQANAFWVTIVHLLERGVDIKSADVDPNTLNIDPTKIEALITERTKAIYLVHFGGNPADMDSINAIARKHGITVVEDCAHASGAIYKGKKVGWDSDIACFSFGGHKNISSLGEGGMVVTKNEEYAQMVRGLRTNYPFGNRTERSNHGFGPYQKPANPDFMRAGDAWDYDWTEVREFGSSYRMSSANAAVGRIQLTKLDALNKMRAAIADRYNSVIAETRSLRMQEVFPDSLNALYLFNFCINSDSGINRDELVRTLEEKYKVKTVLRYWPIHLSGVMRSRGHDIGECPVYEHVWFKELMTLPIAPQMEPWEIEQVANSLGAALGDLAGN